MISPQGYNLGDAPENTNPFWGGGEDTDVNRIYATAEITGGTGTPSVQTSKTVSGHDITFGFSFNNLKGETGAQGERGLQGIQGERGPAGPAGADGQDAVSPTIDVVTITGGHRVDITDAQGTESFNVLDGQDGAPGAPGQSGQDGVSPTIDVVNITGGHRVDITDAQGTESFNVLDGQNGSPGAPGQNGQDGITPDITLSATADATASASPTVTVTKSGTTANPAFALAFSGLKGETGATGATGSQGPQGPAGQTGATGPAGPGVPAGGTAGQVLQKVDGTDYNTKWATPAGGGGYTPEKYVYSGSATISIVQAATKDSVGTASMVRVHVGAINSTDTFGAYSSYDSLTMRQVEDLIRNGKGYLIINGHYSQSRPSTYREYYVIGSLMNVSYGMYYVDGCTWQFEYDTGWSLWFIRTAQ